MNDELTLIQKKNFLKTSDFTVQINNLRLDKHINDLRMLKMKLWLHFHEQNLEVADVYASCTISRPLYHHLLKMQSL